MNNYRLVCAADLEPFPEVRTLLESLGQVRYVVPCVEALAQAVGPNNSVFQ